MLNPKKKVLSRKKLSNEKFTLVIKFLNDDS